jgi:hypothetical protein
MGYVSKRAFILPRTIKENILFHKHYSSSNYEAALKVPNENIVRPKFATRPAG